MDLYVLALANEPHSPYAWLDENAQGQWLCTGIWTYEDPPVASPSTLPCLVPLGGRKRLQLADCEETPAGHWIITEHKVGVFELRHWRQVAFMAMPLPCGGVFPWERVQFRVRDRLEDVAAAFVRKPYQVRGDLLVVAPEDAPVLLGLRPGGLIEWMGMADL